MKKCLKCGAESNSKFCPECGAKMPETRVCPNCGAETDRKFCAECGCQVIKDETVETEKSAIDNSVDTDAPTDCDVAVEPEESVGNHDLGEKAEKEEQIEQSEKIEQREQDEYVEQVNNTNPENTEEPEQITFEPTPLYTTPEMKYKAQGANTPESKPKMSKKKKIIIGVIIVLVLLFMLGTCGGGTTDTSTTDGSGYSNTEETGSDEYGDEGDSDDEYSDDESDYDDSYEDEELTDEEVLEEAENFDTSQCKLIGYEKLARNPDDHIGKMIKVSGRVVQVMEGDDEYNQLRVAVNDNYDTVIYVEYDHRILESRVLEDDYLTIYGMSMGTITYESTLGGNITIPSMIGEKIVFN